MSYDIGLADIEFDTPHDEQGGNYVFGGTTEPWLNITYNYAQHFYRVFGDKGIRALYGMTAQAGIPLLESAIRELNTDSVQDYWAPTEGNARLALQGLLRIAEQAVTEGKGEATWKGD